ncbi:myelin-associated oligodendrocyte basic protein [Parasponia andersonii]|uniref:Myelin-associated oligodendrocyte basic protein n=1 Tax=Parasponia andersonii TaxID=3476 RepID=A0A2P5DKT1_PARAD|nr:myelin-associated oligodendrocyte basic protein [Parasponia andersonii]
MAASSSSSSCSLLLEANPLKWKQSIPILLPPPRPFPFPKNHILTKPYKFSGIISIHGSAKLTLRCFAAAKNRPIIESESTIRENRANPFEVVANTIMRALKALKKPAIAAVLLGLLLMYDPNSALAASGGRMGGRSFSSRSSSSSSSRSYSVPPSSGSGFSYSVPYYAPSPFGFGGGGGVYVGPAVGVGAGSSFFFILMGFAAFVLVSGFLSDRSEDSVLTAIERTSVLKVQVGLLGMARELQMDLNRIAETADTSTPEGLSYVLTETTLALLRHPDYCISGYSSVDLKKSVEEGEKRFNQLSIEERGKFDEETLVNVNNLKRQSTTTQRASGFSNEYIVITVLVAAEGVHKLPAINGGRDLKEALQKLASIPSNKILAVEVLWTPQNENDTLSERELLEDYPLLRPL